MNHVEFSVFGKPAQQGSKRLITINGSPRMIEANDKAKKNWRASVIQAAAEAMAGQELISGPVYLWVVFRFYRPKSHFGSGRNCDKLKPSAPQHHAQIPDLDKLVRNVCDSLSGIVFRDDSQVCSITASREWTLTQEGAVISVAKMGSLMERATA